MLSKDMYFYYLQYKTLWDHDVRQLQRCQGSHKTSCNCMVIGYMSVDHCVYMWKDVFALYLCLPFRPYKPFINIYVLCDLNIQLELQPNVKPRCVNFTLNSIHNKKYYVQNGMQLYSARHCRVLPVDLWKPAWGSNLICQEPYRY